MLHCILLNTNNTQNKGPQPFFTRMWFEIKVDNAEARLLWRNDITLIQIKQSPLLANGSCTILQDIHLALLFVFIKTYLEH